MQTLNYFFDKICGARLRAIGIELTNFCNLSCGMCYSTGREKGFMTDNLFTWILNNLSHIKSVKQIGLNFAGESLLHPNFDELVSCINTFNPDWRVGLSTNGLLLKDHINTFNHYIDFVNISMDGHDLATQAKLKLVIDKLTVPEIRVSTTWFNKTEEDILRFRNFWKEAGIKSIDGPYISPENGFHFVELVHIPSVLQQAYATERTGHCRSPFNYMAVLWNGDTTICCSDLQGKYVIGDVRDNSIEEVWNSYAYQELRKRGRCEGCRV